jgi:flagellar protein FliO/FliZ
MNSLFGVDLPTPVNFVIAFVVVLLLIGAATWLVRRFGATRLDAAARSRQPRLAVVDAAAVDGRRKLVIIRRDNVEHLLMIGGPTDVVVETNIVRAAISARDTAPGRNGHALPEPGPAPWPEPTPAPPPMAARPERAVPRMAVEDNWQPTPDAASQPAALTPPVRAVRPADTLASLAHELGRAAPEPQPAPRPVMVETPAPPPAPAPVPAPAAPQAAGPDQSLAEMAQRLEAALRRPKPVAAAAPVAAPPAEVKAPPRQPRVVVAAPKGGAQPAVQPQNNLEQEMASLLNKPGKT